MKKRKKKNDDNTIIIQRDVECENCNKWFNSHQKNCPYCKADNPFYKPKILGNEKV